MAKKIFDILPPEKIKKEKREIFLPAKEKKVKIPDISFPKITFPSFEGIKFSFKIGRAILVVALILLGVFAYFTLPKVEIKIQPESEILKFETRLNIDQNLNIVDFSSKTLPGRVFEIRKEITEEFVASGRTTQEKKAEGQIRVYNAYSTSPQVLVATTRFVSAEGKLFRSIERITIPGGHYEGGKLVPGFLDIKVRADQPGEEFNIGPSTFSIPGFAGTPSYTYFYGKSFEPMTGGLKKEVSQVTQEDLDKAKNILTEKANNECNLALKEKIPSEFILSETATKTEILDTSSSVKINEIASKFAFRVEAESKTLSFKSKDLEGFVEHFISFQIPTGKKLDKESLNVNYRGETIDLKSGKGIFLLTAEGKVYSDIDLTNLKKALKDKTQSETKFYLENHPQIVGAQVRFWPFWVKKIPQNEEKIKIELKVDPSPL